MSHNAAKRIPLTDEEIERARRYADAGLSATEIAGLLNTTVAKIDYHVFAARRVEAHRRAREDFSARAAGRVALAHVEPPPTEPSIADLCRPPVPGGRTLERERQNLSIRIAGKRKPKPF